MAVPGPISQMWTVASYVIGQKLKGRKQYPLVLMLEPLLRCNLACAGCGKIQYPAHVLKKQSDARGVFPGGRRMRRASGQHPRRRAADAPADPGDRCRASSRARSTSICAPTRCCSPSGSTNSRPASIFRFPCTWTAQREHHDFSVCREGTYDKAVEGIRLALSAASASRPTPPCSMAPIRKACASSSTT